LAEIIFWLALVGVLYTYAGYPLLLWLVSGLNRRSSGTRHGRTDPGISMIVPFHNEESSVARKLANTAQLDYSPARLQVLLVSDGSTDRTEGQLRRCATPIMTVIALPVRQGKAAALNAGLTQATNDIVVFSDASIELAPDALRRIVEPFGDESVGTVSGEDRIAESGGEGWYGRYELFLRLLESRVHSIVGASGSFYAQRRQLCLPFVEGMAPDFLSVLRTVDHGYRAVSESAAVGAMRSVKDPAHEFERKVRTSIRGMTTLFAHGHLLNPLRTRVALQLWSHKLLRWSVPFFLILAFVSSSWLLTSPFYAWSFAGQSVFYLLALAAHLQIARVDRTLAGKVALYFCVVNAALLVAWVRYARGVRLELWTPSRR